MTAHQRSLFACGAIGVDTDAPVTRVDLDATAWIDVGRSWLRGADSLLDALVDTVPWTPGAPRDVRPGARRPAAVVLVPRR